MATNDAKVWRCETCAGVLAWHVGELLLVSLAAALDVNASQRVNCRGCGKWQTWHPLQLDKPARTTGELKTL